MDTSGDSDKADWASAFLSRNRNPGEGSLSYVPALDGVRALAVSLVIYHHWIDGNVPVSLGAVGVKLFFVLSGFLITRLLLDSRFKENMSMSEGLKRFYVRRTLRIFPLYYLVLAAAALTSRVFRQLWPWYVTYLQNIKMMRAGQFLFAAHLWTLAIEEQFYVVWPFVVFALPRRAMGWALMAIVTIGPLWRLLGYFAFHLTPLRISFFTLASFDSLGMGALLAWMLFNHHVPRIFHLILLALTGAAILFLHVKLKSDAFSIVLFDTGVTLLSFLLVTILTVRLSPALDVVFRLRPLAYVGRISYGIYIYHFFVPAKMGGLGTFLERLGGRPLSLAGTLAMTLLVASLSWHFFEMPINNLKDRITSRRTEAIPVDPEPFATR